MAKDEKKEIKKEVKKEKKENNAVKLDREAKEKTAEAKKANEDAEAEKIKGTAKRNFYLGGKTHKIGLVPKLDKKDLDLVKSKGLIHGFDKE